MLTSSGEFDTIAGAGMDADFRSTNQCCCSRCYSGEWNAELPSKYPRSGDNRQFVEGLLKLLRMQNPTGRMGTESEISAAVCFLLSPAASYINGATIKVDGGSSLVGGSFGIRCF